MYWFFTFDPLPSPPLPTPAADKPLAYPTSAKTKRDWTAVGKEVQQEEADEKPQGEVRIIFSSSHLG